MHARLTAWNPWATYMGMDPKRVTRRVKHIEMLSWESLFIPSWLSMRRSTMSSMGVNS
jgi:hypothetical protein